MADHTLIDRDTARRIAQAIGDPGSIVGRRFGPSWGVGNDGYAEKYETVTHWGHRAVLSVLGLTVADTGLPSGLDARLTLKYTVHCSHCGKAAPCYDGEGRSLWEASDLPKLGSYYLNECCDWKTNDGLIDPDFEGRALVCPECWSVGWCETCDGEVHAWQAVEVGAGAGVMWHKACGAPGADAATKAEAGRG